MKLADIEQALSSGDELAALDRALDGWRTSRAAPLATLAETLSARFEPHLPPLAGKPDAFQPLWLALAKQKRAVDLPRLLRSVLHGTNRFGTAVVDALVARGAALAAWPADPRASAIIADHLARGGYECTSKSTYPFWTAMFELLETHADPRAIDRLEKIQFAKVFRTFSDGAKRIAWFQAQLDGVVARLRDRAPAAPLTAAVSQRATKLAQQLAKRGPVAPTELAKLVDPVPAKPPTKRPKPAAKLTGGGSHVDHALRALEGGDDRAALRSLADAWRGTRATRLADLVERVSARCEARLQPIDGSSRAAIQTAWLDIAKEQRAEDLPRLLASIAHTHFRSTDALARVQALASWPSDPRTLAGVIGQLSHPRFYASSSRPFWAALIALAVDHQDPRAADAFADLAARYHRVLVSTYTNLTATITWFRGKLADAARQLRERVPAPLALDAATTRTCDAIAAVLAVDDQLLAEIYAHPDDDHPRQVLADHLQQRGDPRGEFIALQLANNPRAHELARAYAGAWLGPFGPYAVVDECRFERGFLVHLHLRQRNVVPKELRTHPMLTTVRTVTFATERGVRSIEKKNGLFDL